MSTARARTMDRATRARVIGELVRSLLGRDWYEAVVILREFDLQQRTPYRDWDNEEEHDAYLAEMLSAATDDDLREIQEALGLPPLERAVSIRAQRRVWHSDDGLRLFISHLAEEYDSVSKVAEELRSTFGVVPFVAHRDIEPTRDWIEEIEAALFSCEAMAVFLHDGFDASPWTDQEVGVGFGRDLLIIPVKFDYDPYGFLARFQAVSGGGSPFDVSVEIMDALVDNEKTQVLMTPHVVSRFERSRSSGRAESWMRRLERVDQLPQDLLERIAKSPSSNEHIRKASLDTRLDVLLKRHDYEEPSTVVGDFGEEPF